jgi:hypothetical protein
MDNNIMIQRLKESQSNEDELKKDAINTSNRLRVLEKVHDELEIKKDSLHKQSEIQRS